MSRTAYPLFKASRRFIDLQESMQLLLDAPLLHLMTMMVLSFSLSLISIFWGIIHNIQNTAAEVGQGPEVALFLRMNTGAERMDELRQRLLSQSAVREVAIIEPDEGLAILRERYQLGDIVEDLKTNPLPPVLRVSLEPGIVLHSDALQALRREWTELPGVASMEVNPLPEQQVSTWARTIDRILSVLIILIGMGCFALAFIATRLVIEHRRDEIQLLLRLGATGNYLRFRLVPLGLWLGLGGGALSMVFSYAALRILHAPMQELAALYDLELASPDNWSAASAPLLLLAAVTTTLLGALMAVGNHIRNLSRQRLD